MGSPRRSETERVRLPRTLGICLAFAGAAFARAEETADKADKVESQTVTNSDPLAPDDDDDDEDASTEDRTGKPGRVVVDPESDAAELKAQEDDMKRAEQERARAKRKVSVPAKGKPGAKSAAAAKKSVSKPKGKAAPKAVSAKASAAAVKNSAPATSAPVTTSAAEKTETTDAVEGTTTATLAAVTTAVTGVTTAGLPPLSAPAPESVQKGDDVKPLTGAAAKPDATRDFKRAMDLFEAGRENEALVSYTDFLRRYPEHALAPDAQFHLGELLFRQRKFNDAISEYLKVRDIAGKKNSPKVADAVLRIGQCYSKLRRADRAEIEWNALLRKYPNSPAANQARIELKGISP